MRAKKKANDMWDSQNFTKLNGLYRINFHERNAAGTVRCIEIILASSPPAESDQLYASG